MAVTASRVTRIGVQPIIVNATQALARQTYRVTEIISDDESGPSHEVSCSNDLSVDGNLNYLHWQSEAALFRVYRSTGGMFEQIAEVETSSFLDDGENAA